MNHDGPLFINRRNGSSPDTQVISLDGPLTLANVFPLQTELRNGELPPRSILDLSGVPYMDSAGLGAVVNFYTHCQRNGVRMVLVGVTQRVMELFKVTRVDTVIPMAATLEAAESLA